MLRAEGLGKKTDVFRNHQGWHKAEGRHRIRNIVTENLCLGMLLQRFNTEALRRTPRSSEIGTMRCKFVTSIFLSLQSGWRTQGGG